MKSHASMNRIYRLVWNAALSLWVAVAENARGRSKGGSARSSVDCSSVHQGDGAYLCGGGGDAGNSFSRGFTLQAQCRAALALVVSAVLFPGQTLAADAANASVVSGAGTVATAGNTTTINQATQRLAIDWTSLSTRANEALVFNQPNASAIALNRIIGSSPSEMLGSLTANGQVFILNPNGVLFGAGSQVNVGGLVASTMNLGNADFEAGNLKFSGSGAGSVINQGTMTAASGGYLALLAPEVRNEGVMVASLGTALLAAGNKVTLNLDNGTLLGYSIDQGAINALAENRQLIQADGGQVLLSAKALNSLTTATVNNTGIIEARTLQNKAGRIMLMGDMETGTVNVGGTLDASAPMGSGTGADAGGNGGFIETSAAHVKVAAGFKVTALAENGKTGKWLIDPKDFTIAAAGGNMTGAQVGDALQNSDFEIRSSDGLAAGSGDINVNDAVSWSANTLTLTAARDVNINAVMTASGTSALTLNTGAANGADAAVATGNVKVGLDINGFKGGVGFGARTGTGFLTINGNGYTVINDLGAENSTTCTDLQGMNGNRAGYYALGGDIDAAATSGWASGAGFYPVGEGSFFGGTAFTGSFNGLGHTISNLTINRPDADNVGLFGIAYGSTISNVGLLYGHVTGRNAVGPLGGTSGAGTISSSYAAVDVDGFTFVGGLVGISTGATDGSHASGIVNGNDRVGGLIGHLEEGTISDSYATGTVIGTSTGWYVGGLAGFIGLHGSISGSYATGNVTGGSASGGLVGYNDSGTVNNSYAAGNVSGTENVGGLVGEHREGSVNNSYATGSVSGTDRVGGLVGYSSFNGEIRQSYSTGGVSSSGRLGGLAGDIETGMGATVADSYWDMGVVATDNGFGTGKTRAQLMQASTFAGWDMATTGGTSKVWRIYEGHTGPMLRSFMGTLTLADTTVTYDSDRQFGVTSMAAGLLGSQSTGINAGTYHGYYAENQQGPDITGGALIIEKASLTLAAVTDSKAYDGTLASMVAVNATGLMGSDSVTAAQSFDGKNAMGAGGSTLSVDTGYTVADGNNGGNYDITTTTAAGTINKAMLTVTGVVAGNKTYDGGTAVTLGSIGSLNGLVGGESLNLSQSAASFDSKNAGMARAVTVTGYAITNGSGGGLASNYQLASTTATTSADIAKANLTLAAVTDSKTYDGTTASTASVNATGLLGGDGVTAAQSFGSRNVMGAGGSTLSVDAGYTLADGNNGGNYNVTTTAAAGTINKATLTVTGVVADNKTYDGSTGATLGSIGSLSGLATGETLTLSQSAAAFDSKNAGMSKTVTVTGYAITNGSGGGLAGNYQLSSTTATTSADIGKANLTLAAVTDSKTYDGTTASMASGNVTGLVGGDSVTGLTQSFGSKNAMGAGGSTLAVDAGYTVADGNNGGNYNVTTATAAGTINKATLIISATPENKVYDGTTLATASYTDNRIAGDELTYSAISSFATKNAGTGIAVSVGSISTSGADAGNYTVGSATVVGNTADITPKTLTVAANDETRQAGAPYSGGNGVSYNGLVSGETAAGVLTGNLAYSGDSQGATVAGEYDITPSGLAANGNYRLGFTQGTLTLIGGDAASAALGSPALVNSYNAVLSAVAGLGGSAGASPGGGSPGGSSGDGAGDASTGGSGGGSGGNSPNAAGNALNTAAADSGSDGGDK